MPAYLKSRLPMIAAELDPRVSTAVKAGAELISADAKTKVADPPPVGEGLREAIHVESDGPGYSVVAGSDDVFYGPMVEHGTSHSAPKPFLIPAMEENKEAVAAGVTAVLRTL
jgi:HK97 gp10 family phage protein